MHVYFLYSAYLHTLKLHSQVTMALYVRLLENPLEGASLNLKEINMRTPSIRYADDIKQWDCDAEIDGKWVCARPCSIEGIRFLW